MSTSQAVPVIMIMWSPRSLESKPALAMLEEIAREQAGKFQLVEVDIDKAPAIAQAFQIQGVAHGRRPRRRAPHSAVQGAAAQGTGASHHHAGARCSRPDGRHGAHRRGCRGHRRPDPARARGTPGRRGRRDLDEAIAGWEKVIELNPRDEDAKSHLSRVRLAARSAQADATDPAAHADALFAAGDAAGAFDVLLDLLAASTDAEERDALRLRLLDLFRVAGSSPEVSTARTRLAMLLM